MKNIESKLIVFSTQRLVLDFYAKNPQSIAKAMSMKDFFEHLYFVPNKTLISPVLQKIILYNIISQMPSMTNLFTFERSFLGYLESSDFLGHFFREIVTHNINFAKIPTKDIYGDYAEHLQILESIFNRYNQKLNEYGFCAVAHQDEAQILGEFIISFSQIEVYLDGLLNPFEVWLLNQSARLTPLIIHIRTDRYNKDHFKWLGVEIQAGFEYAIDFTSKAIKTQKPLHTKHDIKAFSFDMRLSQSAYILEKVRSLLDSGVSAQDIVVVLPDMNYRDFLQTLDLAHNLNYAMGRSVADFEWFEKLEKMCQAKAEHTSHIESLSVIIQNLVIPPKILEKMQYILAQYEWILSEIKTLSWEDFTHLFLQEILALSIDDVSGGKVRVIGILETRGLEFEYALIADFNDGFIPRVRDDDMFLNTAMRQALGMPTLKDKQDLQKHYYYQLFCNVQKTRITYCSNDEESQASLLDECGIKTYNGDERFILFPQKSLPAYKDEEIIGRIDSNFIFSATSMNVFLECKRKFYYRYILKVLQDKEPSENLELGNAIHKALFTAFKKYENKHIVSADIKAIKEDFESNLFAQANNKTQEFYYLLVCKQMRGFWREEEKRAKEGFRVLGCEISYEGEIDGRKIKGRFDRIDAMQDGIRILDYKYKKNYKASFPRLQLTLYKMLLEKDSEYKDKQITAEALFLREYEGHYQALEDEDFIQEQEKIQNLITESQSEISFELADYGKCRGCDFAGFCNRL